MNLNGKVAVITGAASGLGARTARYFVENKKARVAIFDLNDEVGRHLAEALGAENAIYCRVDVADEASVAQGIEQVMRAFGAIHVCINCAGVPTPMKILTGEHGTPNCQRFARTVMVNLVGTFNVMAHCIQRMQVNAPENGEERGVVVNVASGAAFDGQVGQTGYASSKAGVVGMALPAARELSDLGIRVNTIAPGLFNTPMVQSLNAHVQEALLTMLEFPKRPGDMAEFASLCAYICENSYLNAECIRLDAALRLRSR